uniref:Fungal lipase-like domain-containing protein n=1 Tax=Araucaria cunninghamii TaxID=56994 RepID=A0A0D6QX10_ARACU
MISSRHGGPGIFSQAPVLSGALQACTAAYKCGGDKREITTNSGGRITVLGFSGNLDGKDFSQTPTKYGDCPINENNDFFGSMVDGGAWKEPRKAARVHQGALKKFFQVWTDVLQQQVVAALESGETILFTGHSIGGAIATLATLAILEKRSNCTSVFCISFGFPLIGDEVLARAVRRQGWANQFCNVVSKADIFSRILLAPCVSVSQPLQILLPYWIESMKQMDYSSTDMPMEEAPPENLDIPQFIKTVLHNASAVVNYSTAANMEPTNKVIEALRPALKISPYRPFGYYMFCSSSGGILVTNYEAVLPMLYYTLAAANEDQAEACITEHLGYGRLYPGVITNTVQLEELSNLALSHHAAASSSQRVIETRLDDLGLGLQNARARLALRAAGEVQKQITENVRMQEEELENFDMPKRHDKEAGPMRVLRFYRDRCRDSNSGGSGYYDAFKSQRNEDDFQANVKRLKLASFWDRIVEMVENHKLPDDFQCREKWIKAGTEYRLLVEPLDIANYYRLGKHEDSGHYLTSARPRRYSMLQKWLEDKELRDSQKQVLYPGITQESYFWAYVEEISWCMKSASNGGERPHDVRAKCDEFQSRVKRMIDMEVLCLEEVVMGDSTFLKWWNELSEEDRRGSPLFADISRAQQAIIENANRPTGPFVFLK